MAQVTRTQTEYNTHKIQYSYTKGHPLGSNCDGWRYSIDGNSWSEPFHFLNDVHNAAIAECDAMGGQERGSGVQCVVCGVTEPHEICYDDPGEEPIRRPYGTTNEGTGALSSLAHSAVMWNKRNRPY
jgi:hypothetical protein